MQKEVSEKASWTGKRGEKMRPYIGGKIKKIKQPIDFEGMLNR